MKVKLLSNLKHDGKDYLAGEIIDLPGKVVAALPPGTVEPVQEEKKRGKE